MVLGNFSQLQMAKCRTENLVTLLTNLNDNYSRTTCFSQDNYLDNRLCKEEDVMNTENFCL